MCGRGGGTADERTFQTSEKGGGWPLTCVSGTPEKRQNRTLGPRRDPDVPQEPATNLSDLHRKSEGPPGATRLASSILERGYRLAKGDGDEGAPVRAMRMTLRSRRLSPVAQRSLLPRSALVPRGASEKHHPKQPPLARQATGGVDYDHLRIDDRMAVSAARLSPSVASSSGLGWRRGASGAWRGSKRPGRAGRPRCGLSIGRVYGAAEVDLSGGIEASPTFKSEGHMRHESGLANRPVRCKTVFRM